MKITCLLEDTKNENSCLIAEHGLSFFVELENRNILFDLGPDQTLIKNAETLKKDLNSVDLVVISHGHNDHGGALADFLKINNHAKVLLQSKAFEPHYSIRNDIPKYNGLDSYLKNHFQVQLNYDVYKEENIIVFIAQGDKLIPRTNSNLYKEHHEEFQKDDFMHEQSLFIKDKVNVLFIGCAHRGVVNILETIEAMGEHVDVVIGGFHTIQPSTGRIASDNYINELADELDKRNAKFYTCHCTGEKVFEQIKQKLGNKISLIHVGDSIEL